MKKKKIAILGSTGSIGKSTLEIIKKDKSFNVYILCANKNFKQICKQIKIFRPKIVIITNDLTYIKVKDKFKSQRIIFYNNFNYLKKVEKKVDFTICAIPGIAGLEPTIKFISISKVLLLANKESIICGWKLINKASKKYRVKLVPIDSEHFSIQQLINKYKFSDIDKIFITASGGPFLNLPKKDFSKITPRLALNHPKWKMGKKISIDSATLVNKVLEVSEALKIFPFDLNFYKIIIHPQSLVHAIIQLKNGTKLFLYHDTDMKIPISNALESNYELLKKKNKTYKIKNLNFIEVDKKKFPIVDLIPKINSEKSSLIVFNAANEIFVDQFLNNNIDFTDITRYLKLLVNSKKYIILSKMNNGNLDKIKKIDFLSRKFALSILNLKSKNDY